MPYSSSPGPGHPHFLDTEAIIWVSPDTISSGKPGQPSSSHQLLSADIADSAERNILELYSLNFPVSSP